MFALIGGRLATAFLTVLAVTLLAGALIHLVPGDPVMTIMGHSASITPEIAEKLRERLGLDLPIWQQVLTYAARAMTGDLGVSFSANVPVTELILLRLPNTLILSCAGLFLAVGVGIPAGYLTAINRGNAIDTTLTILMVLAISVPSFWLGLIVLQIFAVQLHWFPVVAKDLSNLPLPAITLGLVYSPVVARLTRSSVIDILGEDFVRTARARGLPEWQVLTVHVLRPAMVSILTVVGLIFAHIISGQVIVENVFSWNGLGRLAVHAMLQRDYPTIQGFIVVSATAIVLTSTLIELLYGLVDPRMRAP